MPSSATTAAHAPLDPLAWLRSLQADEFAALQALVAEEAARRGQRDAKPAKVGRTWRGQVHITRQELAERWRKTTRTIDKYLNGERPVLPSVLVGARRLVKLSDVEAFEQLQRNGRGKLGPSASRHLQRYVGGRRVST